MSSKILFVTLLSVFLPKLVPGQVNHCQSIENCNLCIGTKDCVWCNNHAFEGKGATLQIPRCDTLENHEKRNDGFCGSREFLEITSSGFKQLERRPVNQAGRVHLSPQTAETKLAAGKPVTFEIEYLEDTDKYLDLYYIMDLSATMEDDKDQVVKSADKLAIALRQLSKNVRFGFGSFVDKPLLPFSSYNQLTQNDAKYDKPYGFRNHLPLTSDINTFKTVVNNARISYNTDVPEGGFDAIMQAIVCEKEIGWTDNRTKLIVVASDGPYHIAGDGRLVGVVRPNDMKCHLENGYYTHSTLLDYPSVGQLNHVAKKYKTYIIFATTREEVNSYRQLADMIEPARMAELTQDSNNVVELVKGQYNDIKGNVELGHSWTGGASRLSQFIDVKYEVKCPGLQHWVNSKNCTNVGPGERFRFRVTLTMDKCPPTELGKNAVVEFTTFQLKNQQQLRIAVELDCACNCSGSVGPFDMDKELLSSTCAGQAKRLQCGQCVCNDNFSGRNCECNKVQGISTHLNREGCISNDTQSECSGRGECICGQCDCSKAGKWGGRYCECDQADCFLNPENPFETECSNGKGRCNCGKCECIQERFGDQCQCRKDLSPCMEPGTNAICNGNGDCSCSNLGATVAVPQAGWDRTCSCNPRFQGTFCHICTGTGCPTQQTVATRCRDEKLQKCVKCHIKNGMGTSKDVEDCSEHCVLDSPERDISQYDVIIKKDLDVGSREKISCAASYNATCLMSFTYEYETDKDRRFALKIEALETVVCQLPVNIIPIIIYAAGGVIVVGLLTLLLWKLFTYVHDTREFRKFEKERSAAKWAKGENPLYTVPTSRFENPAYRN